jgi:nifR3 family TIM-barrel protein
MKWKIGNVEIDNQVVLAPMAGICDSAFRRIVKSMGCGLIETEMVSANSLRYDNWKTKEMLFMTEEERPISQQIFGADSESFRIASKQVYETMNPDIIDINMGCPVTKVAVKSHSGSALLKNPEKIEEIVETVVDSVPIPVTVKIRSGWNHKSINVLEVAGIIEDAGASAIAVHPRTREDRYDVPADWEIIKKVKDITSIPVIGNGDIWSCYDAKSMIDETSCDAIMIGRAVRGNPWLIRECVDYLEQGIEPQKVTLDEKITMIKKHVELLSEKLPENVAIHKMRTHASYYLKNSYRSSEIKPKLFKIDTKEELYSLLEDYRKLIAR